MRSRREAESGVEPGVEQGEGSATQRAEGGAEGGGARTAVVVRSVMRRVLSTGESRAGRRMALPSRPDEQTGSESRVAVVDAASECTLQQRQHDSTVRTVTHSIVSATVHWAASGVQRGGSD